MGTDSGCCHLQPVCQYADFAKQPRRARAHTHHLASFPTETHIQRLPTQRLHVAKRPGCLWRIPCIRLRLLPSDLFTIQSHRVVGHTECPHGCTPHLALPLVPMPRTPPQPQSHATAAATSVAAAAAAPAHGHSAPGHCRSDRGGRGPCWDTSLTTHRFPQAVRNRPSHRRFAPSGRDPAPLFTTAIAAPPPPSCCRSQRPGPPSGRWLSRHRAGRTRPGWASCPGLAARPRSPPHPGLT